MALHPWSAQQGFLCCMSVCAGLGCMAELALVRWKPCLLFESLPPDLPRGEGAPQLLPEPGSGAFPFPQSPLCSCSRDGRCPREASPVPLPSPLSSRQESSRARQCCWLVTGQPLRTMQGCGSGGAQLQGWTRAWIPHPCTAWQHMDHDWAQGRTHVLPPGRPSLLPPPHLRAASGQVHPQVPIKSPDLGILLLPPLPHPKHHGQSQGCTRESSRRGSSRVPLPVRSLWSCSVPGLGPSCPLGRDTQAVLRAPGATCRELCCHRGAALAAVRSVLDHRSCSGLAMPIAELQTMGQAPHILLQRSTPEDPEQHPKDLYCFCRSPRAPACLCRCDTYGTLVPLSVPQERELWDSVQAEVGHAPKWGSRFRGCPPRHLPSP